MVDCLVDLVLRPGEHGMAPVQAQLIVVATVRTMLGGDDPGEIGGDVVPAETVRALARALGLVPADGPDGDATDSPDGAASGEVDARPAAAPDEAPPASARRTAGDDRPAHPAADASARAAAGGLTDLLGARTIAGTALAHRPAVALVDELTGQLLALTDAAGLRAGQALGPPPRTDRYAPSAELTRYVQRRDERCRFPGCRRPGHRCDLHHVVRYPLGDTSAENLCCLCRHHHRLVHQAPGWQLAALADGGLRFTTPTGQVVVTHPDGDSTDPPDEHPPEEHPRGTRTPDTDPVRPPGDDPPPF